MSHKAIIFQETAGLESPNHAGGCGSTAGETRPAQACGRAGYVWFPEDMCFLNSSLSSEIWQALVIRCSARTHKCACVALRASSRRPALGLALPHASGRSGLRTLAWGVLGSPGRSASPACRGSSRGSGPVSGAGKKVVKRREELGGPRKGGGRGGLG